MAIYPTQSNYIIDVDIITTTAFKAGMVLMRDDNGRAIPADNSTLLYLSLQRKAGKHLGFASSDHDVSGLTIIEPDVISASWLDNNKRFQRYENAEILHARRAIQEHLDPTYDISNPSNRSTIGKIGIGVYNQPGELYITDQFKPVLHGDFGQDYTDIQTINPGDLLTVGSGINAGKMVKVNVNSTGTDIIVVGVVDKYDVNSGLLYFTNAFYSVTFSSSSAVLALDAGNSLSFPNTGSIGTVCGTILNGVGPMVLTAPAGHVFDKVLFASLGTPTGTCGNFTIGSCHSVLSQSTAESLILGNNSVSFSFDTFVASAGDPCGGTFKFIYIQARFAPTQAKDLTINNNNGTLTNGVTYDTAGGGSWSFDGTNDFIQFSNKVTPPASTPFTVSVWFRRNRNNTVEELLSEWTFATTSNAFFLGFDGTLVRFSDKWLGITVSGSGVTNVWMNMVAINTVSNAYIYLNGNLAATNGGIGLTYTGSGPLTIGRQGEFTEFFQGNISDVRIYNRALPASEILAYYNYTKSRYGL
jgi:hypothetical protein